MTMAAIDWATILLSVVFVFAGIVTWMWGFYMGVSHGREIERDISADRAAQRSGQEHRERL